MTDTNFTLLITHLHDNDRAALRLTGGKNSVFFKLGYVPPYEEFRELKQLQLRTKNADLFGGDAYIIMDLSEWVRHETEEYFSVTMKYLHDQSYKWRYIFTVGNNSLNAVKPMLNVIKCYLHGEVHEDSEKQINKYKESDYDLRL